MTDEDNGDNLGPLHMTVRLERWDLKEPFRFAGHSWPHVDVVVLRLQREGLCGRGEAAGVYYRGDTPQAMLDQLESIRGLVEAGMARSRVQTHLPAGGARNALDCAMWDFEAQASARAVWQLAGLRAPPRRLVTTMTLGIDSPELMARKASAYSSMRALKIKLSGDEADADRVSAVRQARGDVWLAVDANQALNPGSLEMLMPVLEKERVAIIEQPFAAGCDQWLVDFRSPIPIIADESFQVAAQLPAIAGRFDGVNIKLDKCGGLTEGLAIAREARRLGLKVMVGNMLGTSLAMAPAYVVGQLCDVVDLDGPCFLLSDRELTVAYHDGHIDCPPALWGAPRDGAEASILDRSGGVPP